MIDIFISGDMISRCVFSMILLFAISQNVLQNPGSSSNQNVDDLLREHERQQQLLKVRNILTIYQIFGGVYGDKP